MESEEPENLDSPTLPESADDAATLALAQAIALGQIAKSSETVAEIAKRVETRRIAAGFPANLPKMLSPPPPDSLPGLEIPEVKVNRVRPILALEQLLPRSQIVERLQHAPEISPDEERFLAKLTDPTSDAEPIDVICRKLDFTISKFFGLLRKGFASQALQKALDEIYEKLPLVAKDVMMRALPHHEPCTKCFGYGQVQTDELGQHWVRCVDCNELGYIEVLPRLEYQKLALSIGGLFKAGPGVQVNTQVNTTLPVPRSDSAFRSASDKILFAQGSPVDAEVVPPVDRESQAAEI